MKKLQNLDDARQDIAGWAMAMCSEGAPDMPTPEAMRQLRELCGRYIALRATCRALGWEEDE